jgi:alditol oxidase
MVATVVRQGRTGEADVNDGEATRAVATTTDVGRNWSGNVAYSARRLLEPESVDDLRRLVASSTRLRPLGTRHSFSTVADTSGDLVSVARLPRRIDLDPDAPAVTVSAGLRFGELAPELDRAGWALGNLGSLPHISVAGACATGTHGSGSANRIVAATVAAVEFVAADGDLVTLRRGDDGFEGAVVALGRLGVVTALTLDVRPRYEIRQLVHLGLSGDAAIEHATELLAGGYSVSLFSSWGDPLEFHVLSKHLGDEDATAADLAARLGATAATRPWNPVPGMPAENCTDQLGVLGPWYARLPHFKLEFTPSSGDELQSEYYVATADATEALRAVASVADVVAPVLQVGELRSIAADDLWLSPASGRDVVGVHFTWVEDMTAVLPALRAVEERLAPFGARPHWGKVFTTPPEVVRSLYPRLADAAALARRFDPEGVFGNRFVEAYLNA